MQCLSLVYPGWGQKSEFFLQPLRGDTVSGLLPLRGIDHNTLLRGTTRPHLPCTHHPVSSSRTWCTTLKCTGCRVPDVLRIWLCNCEVYMLPKFIQSRQNKSLKKMNVCSLMLTNTSCIDHSCNWCIHTKRAK